jgi:ABC-type multidrug transport system permease subunit
VNDGDLAAAVIVPKGYTQALLDRHPIPLITWTDPASQAGATIQREILAISVRLSTAVQAASSASEIAETGQAGFQAALAHALDAWQDPPVRVETSTAAAAEAQPATMSSANTSPGMMLQFAIAGLLTAAQVLVNERKSRSLERLLTTATQRTHILLGHYLAILVLLLVQFSLLIIFGQLALGLKYFAKPAATLLILLATSMCIAAMGLLIGVLAKTEEQAILFSLVPMFVLSGIGGAWVPLEITSETFQVIGHLSPVAWAMDGFKNVLVRGLGLEANLLPAAALLGYALLFFVLAAWRFRKAEA